MEDYVVVVAVFGVGDEVFDGFGGSFGEESDRYVAVCGVDYGGCADCGGFCGRGGFGVDVARFFVLDVALGFGYSGFWLER